MTRLLSLIALLLLSCGGQAAPTVVLDSPVVNLTDFAMATFVDETETLAFETVRNQAFTPSSNRVSLGTQAKTTWSRIELVNRSGQDLELFLHHPYATTTARSPSFWRTAIPWWTARFWTWTTPATAP